MAVYLDQIERDLLKKLIGTPKEFEWVKLKLLSKIEDDEVVHGEIANHKHEYFVYEGLKTECICGSRPKEVWFVKNKKHDK